MKKNPIAGLCLLLGFMIGAYKGYIALWRQGQPDPIRVFPYSVTSLPPADQAAVKEGIILESESELQQLLQDYLS